MRLAPGQGLILTYTCCCSRTDLDAPAWLPAPMELCQSPCWLMSLVRIICFQIRHRDSLSVMVLEACNESFIALSTVRAMMRAVGYIASCFE